VYDDITLETVALDTSNKVAVFVANAPSKRVLMIYPLSQSDEFIVLLLLHMDCHSTKSLCTDTSTTEFKQTEGIQCCQLKFFQCSQQKFYSSIV
jgi:hypothetical protein